MTHPRTHRKSEEAILYEIYTIENSEEKTLVFLLFSFTAAAGQNSSDLYSKLFMHVAGTPAVRIALYFRNFA